MDMQTPSVALQEHFATLPSSSLAMRSNFINSAVLQSIISVMSLYHSQAARCLNHLIRLSYGQKGRQTSPVGLHCSKAHFSGQLPIFSRFGSGIILQALSQSFLLIIYLFLYFSRAMRYQNQDHHMLGWTRKCLLGLHCPKTLCHIAHLHPPVTMQP